MKNLKKIFAIAFLIVNCQLSIINCFAQNIGINEPNPDNSAILEMTSPNRGLLISRMTTAGRDTMDLGGSPESVIIFNTDNKCFQTYIDGQWQNIFCNLGCSTAPPTPGAITGNTTPCQNATGESYSIAQVSGATSYSWAVPSGATITAGQGTTGIIVTFGTSNGNVSVTASNNCGTSAAQTLAITLSEVPAAAGSISGTTPVCQSQNGVAYSVGAITGATGYVWTYTGTGFTIATGTNTNSITADFSGSATSGNLTVYGTNGCGNGTASPNYAITVNTAPSAPTAGTHTPSATQIIWNWNTVAGATGYKYNTVNNYGTATDNGASTTYTQTGLTCETGYTLYVWAYNTCGNSSSTTLNQTTSACFTCGTSTVDDIDGNTYNTVLIGSQCWLKENMRTTKYPDGSAITKGPSAHGAAGWDNINTAYYSCPPNTGNNGEDCAAAASLGMSYQWKAAMNGSTVQGAQGVCPTGWHIPTDAEWKTLEGELGMSVAQQDATGWRGTNEASKMADNVADQNWTAGNLTGDANFGSSGLKVGPSGFRGANGSYYGRSGLTYLWSSTESGPNAWGRHLNYTGTQVNRLTNYKAGGFSVRCVKD